MVQLIDSVTRILENWLRQRFPAGSVVIDERSIEPDTTSATRIELQLAKIAVESGDSRQTTLRLDYFVTVHASDPYGAHQVLGEIAFGLAETPVLSNDAGERCTIRIEENTKDVLGLALSTRLTRARQQRLDRPVLHPLVARIVEMSVIEGMVTTADGVPLGDALVEIPLLNARQMTGADGKFRFSGLPAGDQPIRIVARKQKAERSILGVAGDPVVLELSLEG